MNFHAGGIAASMGFMGMAFLSAQSGDLLPPRWFEQVAATDGSVQKSWVFQSAPGVGYRIESSQDLLHWETLEEIYGLGHQQVVPLVEIAPAPPPEPGDPPPEQAPTRHVSLMIAPEAPPATGTVVSWPSLASGAPMTARIPQALHPDWSSMPLFADHDGDYFFLIFHLPSPQEAPAGGAPLAPEDEAMIEAFQDHLPEMNDAVANSVATARAAPPPPPPSPGGRKFLRLVADWNLDSDADGSPDWAEFTLLLDPAHPQHLLGSPFVGDADGDGVADGEQLDSDNDSIPDAEDAAPRNPLIRWRKSPLSVYAVFELPLGDLQLPWVPDEGPVKIDHAGRVMFRTKVWDRGDIIDFGGDTRLLAMNDRGMIVGDAWFEDADTGITPHLGWWATPRATVQELKHGDTAAKGTFVLKSGSAGFGSALSEDGKIIVRTQKKIETGEGHAYPYLWVDEDKTVIWDLEPENPSAPPFVPAPDFGIYIHDSGAIWGNRLFEIETYLTGLGTGSEHLGDLEAAYKKLVGVGGGDSETTLVLTAGPGPPRARISGQWETISELEDIRDISSDGTGIEDSHLIWRNRLVHYLPELAPGLDPGEWNAASFLDIAGSGALLAALPSPGSPGEFSKVASAIPIRVDDDVFATGVDDVSATARPEEQRQGGRIWIMAPAGGSPPNASVVHVPTAPGTSLSLEVGNAGIQPDSLSEDETEVNWSSDATASSDQRVEISFGDTDSLSTPIGVKAIKRRTVKLHFWHIAQNHGLEGRVNPEHTFTPTEIGEYLDDLYGKQVNAFWDVNVSGATQPIPVNWDVATGADFQQPDAPKPAPGNGSLDSNGRDIGTEQNKILTSAGTDADVDINAYLVGGADEIADWQVRNGTLGAGGSYRGFAHPDSRTIWLSGNMGLSKRELLNTLAHEIGHVMMGGGHPNQGGGPAPLAGTRYSDRLMFSDPFHRGPARRRLLVKGEWDAIDAWLVGRGK
ncbi:thrombospondin type 3 repeat-containing protein [Haloferula sargassicola]|uniref:Uncharacterized protein n=1 Tax=Haloferula sargassicola TaxID=490096 RepID=A0ABP9UI09_9BACT